MVLIQLCLKSVLKFRIQPAWQISSVVVLAVWKPVIWFAVLIDWLVFSRWEWLLTWFFEYTISFFVSLSLSLLDFLCLLLIIFKCLVYLQFFIKCFFGTQNCAFPVSRGLPDYACCGPGMMFIDVASWTLRLFSGIPLFIGKSFIFKDAGYFDPISWGSGEF